ncbi:hypothetical protein EXIGLDRAFT_716525 [Exidia glandulosa HHB12029]|uniref:Uncharacterized protein n=1 Tax=Exidia glandulosa HHB12029 TaxID=1314781 RepID=A0A165PAG0_EXIGL|nr:hypothetical protein EXIGLDRAFT_716525 [Exidia glandulosa HHB12029]
MDQNRAATHVEEQSIRAFLVGVTAARERQIKDARRRAKRTAHGVAQAKARLAEAQEVLKRATHDMEQAVIANTQAEDLLDVAEQPLDDDPYIRLQKGLIHPIRRIPTEILAMLLEASIWAVYSDRVSAFGRPTQYTPMQQTPYRLALVCRRWRNVALTTPAVWRHICVDLSAITRQNINLHKLYLETSFARSARRKVVLRVQRSFSWDDEITFHPEWLRPYIVDITRSDGVVDLVISPLDRDVFDSRNPSVSLHKLRTDECTPLELVHALPSLAPNLRTITVAVPSFIRPPPAAYPSVESVEVERTFAASFTDAGLPHPCENLFGFVPNARQISLDISTGFGTAEHLQHDHVRILRLDYWSENVDIAERYTFPQLEELEMSMLSVDPGDETCRGLLLHLPLIVDGCTNLRTLRMKVHIGLNSKFALMLRSMPRLESLLCPNSSPDKDFAQALGGVGDESVWLCPRLATFQVGRVTEDMCKNLLESLSSRRAAHRRGEDVADLEDVDIGCRNAWRLGAYYRHLLKLTPRARRIQASMDSI